MEISVTNALISNDFKTYQKPEIALLNDARTTTKSENAAVRGGFLLTVRPAAEDSNIVRDYNNNQFLDEPYKNRTTPQ